MFAIEKTLLVICKADNQQLLPLTEQNDSEAAQALAYELDRAEIVAADIYPADAVCMGANVTFVDLDSGMETAVSLVFPGEADVDRLKISILSPVGSALIGLRIGSTIDWPLPGGKVRRLKVIAVHQPEKRVVL